MKERFAAALARGEPASLARQLSAALPEVGGANLAILYATEAAAAALPDVVEALAARGIAAAVGGVGLGIFGGGAEIMEEPAVVALIGALPAEEFRVFGPTAGPGRALERDHGAWIAAKEPALALVHADPRCAGTVKAIGEIATASGAFLVGGLVSHRTPNAILAQVRGVGGFGEAAVAGLMLSPQIGVATALSQGCSPLGPVHRIDEARENIVMTIDGRPALAVFCDDLGAEFAGDLRRLGGIIFAGLPVAGSDTGDYLVRNILAIDPGRGWLVLAEEVAAGDRVLFCRRDPDSARRDLMRMLRQLQGRLGAPPGAAVFVSCIARGAHLFGEDGVETRLIREVFGEVPLVGFFANGEISRDRLYGHTGVLTVFT